MNCKKYRICLMILLAFVVAGSIVYYVRSEKDGEIHADGMFVKNFTCDGGRNA